MDFFSSRGPWYIAGPIIGLCVVGLLWVANRPLGALGSYTELGQLLRNPKRASWRVFFLGGMILGGFLSAILSGGITPTLRYGALDNAFGGTVGHSIFFKAALLTAAGAVMGYGASIAGGCTSGHGICGTSYGSPASFVSTATFMVTAISFTYAMGVLGVLP